MRSCLTLLVALILIVSTSGRSHSLRNSSKADAALSKKADEAYKFCRTQKYNTNFCILINLGKHSGLKRFYVWDFKTKSIAHSFMVSHGCWIMPWSWTWSKQNARFSNKDGSHCSAGGKYRIGKRGYSSWGIHVNYLLYGLEKSNSNAYKRQIVLHSWDKVPNEEVYPDGTPEGWGCPAISNHALKQLDPKLRQAKRPVLLWIFK